MGKAKIKEKVDPFLASIIEARLLGISREIGQKIMKGSYSVAMAAFRDLGTQIYDDKERLVAVASWLPIHTAGSHIALEGILNYIGRQNVHPGDFFTGNSPYIVRAGHLPDWSFMRPVFYKGKPVFYLYARGHQYDSGGFHMLGYSVRAFDIHAEGFILPPTKIFDRGKANEDALRIIMANVRGSEKLRADMQLINSAMALAEERLLDLIEDYGIATVKAAIDKVLTLSEQSVKKIFKKWPGGVYKSRSASDSDGTSPDPVWVNLSLTIDAEKGHLTFDYTDNIKQVDFINATFATLYESTLTPLRWALPGNIPVNQGLLNCITLKTEPGTICHVTYPATCGGQANAIAAQVNECVQLALAQVVPEDVPAAWTRHQSPVICGRNPFVIDPVSGERAYYQTFGHFCADGSSGAILGYDGWDCLLHGHASGAVTRSSMEVSEQRAPWRFIECEWWTDSSGDGQFKGGMGSRAKYVNLHPEQGYRHGDIEAQTGTCNGEKFPPFGLLGGTDGKNARFWIERKGELIPLRTMDLVELEPGDAIISLVGGGGGIGNPLERDIDKVRMDALDEFISLENARDTYGVIIKPESFEVDYEATARLRAEKMSKKKPG